MYESGFSLFYTFKLLKKPSSFCALEPMLCLLSTEYLLEIKVPKQNTLCATAVQVTSVLITLLTTGV